MVLSEATGDSFGQNNVKQLVREQFDECYDKNGWFVAVRNAIEGVTAEQAAWKPEGTDNSIWETLTHLTYYNNAYLQRFKGIDYQYDKADNDETFEISEAASEEDWRGAMAKFHSTMNEFRDLLEEADEAKLSEQVSATKRPHGLILISQINAHNAYHAGQILLLRKLQGSWSPEKGVS